MTKYRQVKVDDYYLDKREITRNSRRYTKIYIYTYFSSNSLLTLSTMHMTRTNFVFFSLASQDATAHYRMKERHWFHFLTGRTSRK